MKIVLAALNAKYVHSNLAVYDIAVYTKEQLKKDMGKEEKMLPEVVVREYTINHNLDTILQSIYMEKAAVVAFSCYIWNIQEILTIARELHKVAPDVRIWLGGPEVSYDSKKLLEEYPFVEGVIQGEGEATFYELVKCWSLLNGTIIEGWNFDVTKQQSYSSDVYEGCVYTDVEGVVYRDHQKNIFQNVARPLLNLSDVPFVYQDLSRFENRILYYETSRGCPFSCSYCLSSIDKSVRFRDLDLVKKELQFFLDNNVSQVKFIDRTFNCKREHALAIWRYITENDNGITNFHFEISADLLGEEELTLFEQMRPGLIQLEIGLQSSNPKTIEEIRRKMDVDKLQKNMLQVHGFGNIHQHLDLIAGLPYEDYVTFQKSFNEAYAMKPNQLQLGFLKVLKGSYMEEQIEEYGLKYQESQPYEVLCTNWISYEEILKLKLVEEMVEVYYNSDQFEHVLSYLIPMFETPFTFYEALGVYYQKHNLFGIGFKRESRYETLREFCKEWFGECVGKDETVRGTDGMQQDERSFSMNIFISLLTYDYYLRENAKSRPTWSKEEPIDKSIYHTFFKNGGTEEFRMDWEGYDSKVAARIMHLEPVVREALPWLIESGSNKEKGEAINEVPVFATNAQTAYCLFDYENRNPLSKDAEVVILLHL